MLLREDLKTVITKCEAIPLQMPRTPTEIDNLTEGYAGFSLFADILGNHPVKFDTVGEWLLSEGVLDDISTKEPSKARDVYMLATTVIVTGFNLQIPVSEVLHTLDNIPLNNTKCQTTQDVCIPEGLKRRISNNNLTSADLQTLQGDNWLNDKVCEIILRYTKRYIHEYNTHTNTSMILF